jgi:hypothetical protein
MSNYASELIILTEVKKITLEINWRLNVVLVQYSGVGTGHVPANKPGLHTA